MAKNTLSFEEIKPEGSVSVAEVAIGVDNSLWHGDEVTLAAGEKFSIPLFIFGNEEVLLIQKTDGTTAATLNLASPSFTNSSGSSKTYYVAVKNGAKGSKVSYEIERNPVTVSWEAVGAGEYGGTEPTVIEIGETEYIVDAVSYAPNAHIKLKKGETIKCKTKDSSGAISLLYITSEVGIAPFEWENSGFTADKDTELCICAQTHYAPLSMQYQITNIGASESDTLVPVTEVFVNTSDTVLLKEGDKIGNTTTGDKNLIVVDMDGKRLATVPNDGSYYKADKDRMVMIGCNVKNTTVSYCIEEANPKYEEEYTGESGILQLKRKEGGKLHFLADAGIGYMQVWETKAKEVMYYLNMDKLDSIKIVSETEVLSAKVNIG